MNQTTRKLLASTGAAALLATTVMAGAAATAVAQDEVEFDFYSRQHLDPGKSFIEGVVADYMAANPGVTIPNPGNLSSMMTRSPSSSTPSSRLV